jgi:hypothetical protein
MGQAAMALPVLSALAIIAAGVLITTSALSASL